MTDNLDSWDKYVSNDYLKAINVNDDDKFVIINVEDHNEDNENPKLRLQLEINEKKYLFDLNVTNTNKIRDLGIESPRKMIGKTLTFKKVLVRNPQTNKEVEGLRIDKIE